MSDVRVAAFQFDVVQGDVDHNLAQVERGLRDAVDARCELVVLPEMWPTSFPSAETRLDEAVTSTERALEHIAFLTQELPLVVCGSAFGRTVTLPSNRWHALRSGRVVAAYDKIHLFTPTAEEASFSSGNRAPTCVDTRAGRLGGIVCYDLRFPEVARALFRSGVEIATVSAQWPETRASHWAALCDGRAVESQCFVVACNRVGSAKIGRRALDLVFAGGSRIVDPEGRVLACAGRDRELLIADIDLDVARSLRVRVPVAKDERRDLYRDFERA
ncbi:MAG: nitrilase-related carbon-nitrogen hydrolase [Planctomycetota bacterium]|nr:nitrilase-related carbon-nitrogen hydrolase [Planctomycetota bacterium]